MVRTLQEYLEYRDGKLYWKKKSCKKVVVGKVAGKYFKSLQAARKAAQQLRDEVHGKFSVNIT